MSKGTRSNREPRGPDELITDQAQLEALTARLAGAPRLALDTEAASFHRYVDRVYLIQISTDDETVLIDPLAVNDLIPLSQRLADAAVEVILHDADYDLRILDRDYGFTARRLFDTRIAAQLAGEPAVGLGALLQKYFQVNLNKKLQRADWSRRPLSADMLIYAAEDTRYLPALRDRLEERLRQLGRLGWAQEEFRRLEVVRWTGPSGDDLDAYLRIRGAKGLRDPRTRAVLRAVYRWRDGTARALDRAPFRVLGNDALLAIARAAPRDLEALGATPSMPPSLVRRYGIAILEAVDEGMGVSKGELPTIQRRVRSPADPAYDQRLERLKQLRNERAKEIAMDPGLVCPNGTLQALARTPPATAEEIARIPELRTWQRELLGDAELLKAVGG
jgi:ribonuclease D